MGLFTRSKRRTILAEPFFLDRDEWIPIPDDMSKNIVVGKSYDCETGAGARLWKAVQAWVRLP